MSVEGEAPHRLIWRDGKGRVTGSTDERLVVNVGPIGSTIRCNVMGAHEYYNIMRKEKG
ncbi:MAG: hypothetical protein AB9903_29680 [Vulcanimicrobiota bacterium]